MHGNSKIIKRMAASLAEGKLNSNLLKLHFRSRHGNSQIIKERESEESYEHLRPDRIWQ